MKLMNLKVRRVMRTPLFITLLALSMACSRAEPTITTTSGEIDSSEAGLILAHEHIFTDLRGPAQPGYGEADPADVIRVMKPLLLEAKKAGVNTLIECTTIGV